MLHSVTRDSPAFPPIPLCSRHLHATWMQHGGLVDSSPLSETLRRWRSMLFGKNMPSHELIKLRDLPSFKTVIEIYRNPRNLEYPQAGYTGEKVYALSVGLFCITLEDVERFAIMDTSPGEASDDQYWPDPEVDPLYYDSRYSACYHDWESSKPFWEAIGWDLSDDDGEKHYLACLFENQIIATVRELVPGAQLHLDGTGRAAYNFDGERVDTVEQSLERDATAFLNSRGKQLRDKQ